LGLHGASGREGEAHMARVARWGGGGANADSGWRRERERDAWPVGWLGMLATCWIVLKATGPKG
jgi:hypothetical protein